MRTAEDYLARAEEAEAYADSMSDEQSAAEMRQVAELWRALARQADDVDGYC